MNYQIFFNDNHLIVLYFYEFIESKMKMKVFIKEKYLSITKYRFK